MADPNVVMNGASAQVPIAGASFDVDHGPHTVSTKIFKYPSDIGADESDTQNFVLFYAKPGGRLIHCVHKYLFSMSPDYKSLCLTKK